MKTPTVETRLTTEEILARGCELHPNGIHALGAGKGTGQEIWEKAEKNLWVCVREEN